MMHAIDGIQLCGLAGQRPAGVWGGGGWVGGWGGGGVGGWGGEGGLETQPLMRAQLTGESSGLISTFT